MWTVSLTVDELNHFPLASHHAYIAEHCPDALLPVVDFADFEQYTVYTRTIEVLGTLGDLTLYRVTGDADADAIVWDNNHKVFWFCCGDCSLDAPWSSAQLESAMHYADELLQPCWSGALAAGWLYRTQLQAPPKDLLSALDRILQP